MRSTFLLTLTGLIVLGFVLFMVTYSVRFTESAVVTTFGSADESSVVNAAGDEAGLKVKWPYPVQSVTKYDRRVRMLETRSEAVLTADDRPIIVEAFATWRVADPLVFYQRFSNSGPEARDHFREASRVLDSLLRSALSEVSGYRMSELFASERGASRLGDLEQAVLRRLQQEQGGQGADRSRVADYGLDVTLVGIRRIVLPQDTTRNVYERMRATRQRMAAEARAQGESVASTIRNEAESSADRILAFAGRLADEIRNTGDIEAARWLQQLDEEPELAVFLQNIQFMREGLGRNATLVLPTTLPGMGVFDLSRWMDTVNEMGAAAPRQAQPERNLSSEGAPR